MTGQHSSARKAQGNRVGAMFFLILSLASFGFAGMVAAKMRSRFQDETDWWRKSVDLRERLATLASGAVLLDPLVLDPSMEGRLVFVHGRLILPQPLRDPVFGIERNAVVLIRQVGYWHEFSAVRSRREWDRMTDQYRTVRETSRKEDWKHQPLPKATVVDGEAPPVIELEWSTATPPLPIVEPLKLIVGSARVGAYRLGKKFIDCLDDAGEIQPITLDAADAARLNPALAAHYHLHEGAFLRPSLFFAGKDLKKRAFSDERVGFGEIPTGEISLVARPQGDVLEFAPEAGVEAIGHGRLAAFDLIKKGRTGDAWAFKRMQPPPDWLSRIREAPFAGGLEFCHAFSEPVSLIGVGVFGGLLAGVLFLFLIRSRPSP